MGFRSTFTVEDTAIRWPDWFVDKWAPYVWFKADCCGVFSSKVEAKIYGLWADLEEDIQKAVDWDGYGADSLVLIWLHECGGITRAQIERDRIVHAIPDGWVAMEGYGHDYCYGCSDIEPEEGLNHTTTLDG